MAEEKAKKNQLIAIIVIIFAIVVVGLAYSSYHLGLKEGEKQMQEKYENALEKHAILIPGLMPNDQEVKNINGKITKIEDRTIYLETKKMTSSVLELGQMTTYKINVGDETKIYKQKGLDISLLLKPDESAEESASLKPEELNISNLKEGDQIKVTSEENIRDKEEFEAEEIRLERSE